ncbi:hypothetical protein ASL14_08255 [Paenibacillus sp. IHB B 3084]|uniref:TIGR00366 family protein n=1 Tax=Paenibacillus sp. IHB B 3084 TaxID=867076 RepID=UPI000720DFBC|nr:TIGR00366 family protein [Paenibacillus sp. IHB B 3084]ALP36159.1 hypothetical protein ASL14_08255 [Paenibacillus sp. IHB B 3084]
MIIDTVLNSLANILEGLPSYLFTTIMLLAHNIITFLVPSSSGEAALTMPVLAPLGDLVDINREAVVTAYQFGNGLTNLISPTGGVLLAELAIAQISFGQWLKVIFKLFPILWLVAVIFAAFRLRWVSNKSSTEPLSFRDKGFFVHFFPCMVHKFAGKMNNMDSIFLRRK